jgi:hypothetical protein
MGHSVVKKSFWEIVLVMQTQSLKYQGIVEMRIACLERKWNGRIIGSCLVAIALIVSLSGSAFLGIGAGSIASAVSSQHVNASAVVAKSTGSVAFIPKPWCPTFGIAC